MKQRSKDVEAYLRDERKKFQTYEKEAKVLILGSSDSGKSTLLKQMKLLHGGGFSEKEKLDSIALIKSNILEAIGILIHGAKLSDVPPY